MTGPRQLAAALLLLALTGCDSGDRVAEPSLPSSPPAASTVPTAPSTAAPSPAAPSPAGPSPATASPLPPERGTVPPDWLGTRPLPLRGRLRPDPADPARARAAPVHAARHRVAASRRRLRGSGGERPCRGAVQKHVGARLPGHRRRPGLRAAHVPGLRRPAAHRG